jgi:type II secretion system protein G
MKILKHKLNKKGFTILELLVVVAIIGLLAGVVMYAVNDARKKARDAKRLSDIKQIQNALELYYDDYGYYPPRNSAVTSIENNCNVDSKVFDGNDSWCLLMEDLLPYLSSIIEDPSGRKNLSNPFYYFYDSNNGDGYKTYGIMIGLESRSNFDLATNDGGYFPLQGYEGTGRFYEVGQQPKYCTEKYLTPPGTLWLGVGVDTVCRGGN